MSFKIKVKVLQIQESIRDLKKMIIVFIYHRTIFSETYTKTHRLNSTFEQKIGLKY